MRESEREERERREREERARESERAREKRERERKKEREERGEGGESGNLSLSLPVRLRVWVVWVCVDACEVCAGGMATAESVLLLLLLRSLLLPSASPLSVLGRTLLHAVA